MRQDTADSDANRTIQMKVKSFYLAAGALVAFLSLTTYGLAGTTQNADTGQPKQQWQNEWEALVKAAKAEGRVVTEGYARAEWAPVFAVFTQKYGIEVIMSAGSANSDRLIIEREAGRFTVDAVNNGAGTLRRVLIGRKMLKPILPQFILPEVKDPRYWYKGRHWWVDGDSGCLCAMAFGADVAMAGARPHFYNTNKLTKEEFNSINSFWDYLNPRFKGRIISWAPPDSLGSWSRVISHPEIGEKWVRRFMFEMEPRLFNEARVMHDRLISGAAAILVVGQRGRQDLFKAMAAGAPVATFDETKFNTWKESAELTFSASERYLSPIHPSPNPNAVRLLLNWLYSKEGQTALHLYHKGIPPPTLREDVTEWGRTDPLERRVPGKEYLVLDIKPKWAEERLRALYDEYRFRGR
jgi:ABC-type Fe3+ transport system substrate-binding protein